MALIAAAILAWGQPTPGDYIAMTDKPTVATYMNPGIMQQVIANRGLSHSDGVALNRAGDLGRTVWLMWDSGEIDGPLVVVDCAQEAHFEKRERQGRVVEVSAELARERGVYQVGPVGVTVWFSEPPPTKWM